MGFFERVYRVVARIPEGMAATYGDIARAIGEPRKAHVVGYAMMAAPRGRGLPCHRVVHADGGLCADAFDGMQHDLLAMEGVPFTSDGRVDLDRCRFSAEELRRAAEEAGAFTVL